MFERYTEDARRSLFFARYEASQLGGATIEPEHLLLGLVREPRLEALFPEGLEQIRRSIAQQVQQRERLAASVEIPFSPATKKILTFASTEADALNQPDIRSEHLLLGILREEDSIAARYVRSAGVRLNAVREFAANGKTGEPPASNQHVLRQPQTHVSFRPVGIVRSPYEDAASIPKGLGTQHGAEGVLEIREDRGRSGRYRRLFTSLRDLVLSSCRTRGADRTPAIRRSAARRVRDPLTATAQSDRPDGCRVTAPRGHPGCMSAASTCSTERRFSTSSPI